MSWISFFLNFSLLLALLVAPCFLLMAHWYRRQMPKTVLVWRKSEMVIITITFLIASLILFIVGISSFFSIMDFADLQQSTSDVAPANLRNIGYICLLLLATLGITYLAIRMLLVQVITEEGIITNDRILRIPDFRNITYWDTITDYYLLSDYPNVIFTMIVQKGPVEYKRNSVRVPVYIRDEFEDLLETKLFSSGNSHRSDVRSQPYSGN